MDPMMAGSAKMAPRKAMGMKGLASGAEDVGGYPGSTKAHPDVGMSHKKMMDADRGIGMPVKHSPDMLPAQAAPRHGTQHEKSMGFMRDGKA